MSALISLLVLGQGIVGGQGQSSAADLSGYYNRRYETTFSGVVTGKTKGQVPGYAQGMSILVKSGKNLREVELGPAWYVGRQAMMINMGDKVKVTATPLVLGKRQKVFLARQIVRGRNILALRDTSGMPYWTPMRKTRVASNNSGGAAMPMGNAYQGSIDRMTTFMVNGEEYAGYVLNTPDGPVNVAVAPTWYWNNQPSYFNPGDNVTFYGNGPASRVGGNGSLGGVGGVTLVNSATYNGGTLLLRPAGGFPVYGGFRPLP